MRLLAALIKGHTIQFSGLEVKKSQLMRGSAAAGVSVVGVGAAPSKPPAPSVPPTADTPSTPHTVRQVSRKIFQFTSNGVLSSGMVPFGAMLASQPLGPLLYRPVLKV